MSFALIIYIRTGKVYWKNSPFRANYFSSLQLSLLMFGFKLQNPFFIDNTICYLKTPELYLSFTS